MPSQITLKMQSLHCRRDCRWAMAGRRPTSGSTTSRPRLGALCRPRCWRGRWTAWTATSSTCATTLVRTAVSAGLAASVAVFCLEVCYASRMQLSDAPRCKSVCRWGLRGGNCHCLTAAGCQLPGCCDCAHSGRLHRQQLPGTVECRLLPNSIACASSCTLLTTGSVFLQLHCRRATCLHRSSRTCQVCTCSLHAVHLCGILVADHEGRVTHVLPGTMTHAPVLLIANRATASASEVLAGALRENGR